MVFMMGQFCQICVNCDDFCLVMVCIKLNSFFIVVYGCYFYDLFCVDIQEICCDCWSQVWCQWQMRNDQIVQQMVNILFVVLYFGGYFVIGVQFLLSGIIFIVYQVFNVVVLLFLILFFILVIVCQGVEGVGCIYCFYNWLVYVFMYDRFIVLVD